MLKERKTNELRWQRDREAMKKFFFFFGPKILNHLNLQQAERMDLIVGVLPRPKNASKWFNSYIYTNCQENQHRSAKIFHH